MKYWFYLPVASAVLGAAIGATTGYSRYRPPELVVATHRPVETTIAPLVPYAKPRVNLVDPTVFDFGKMARGDEQSHTFRIQNIGTGPLTLKVLDTTCKCTVGSLEKDEIPPGETANITLTWKAVSYDREFRQRATIETSDQSQREVQFTVKGQVIQLAMPDIPSFHLPRLSRTEGKKVEFNIFGFRDTDLEVVSHEFQHPETAPFFQVAVHPLPKEQWSDPLATSAIHVTADVLPGLPTGRIEQILRLATNKHDIPPIEVMIEVSIVSDISILSPGVPYSEESNTLTVGPVLKSSGKKVNLIIVAKGKFKDDVQLKVESIDPSEALHVTFGEPSQQDKIRKFPCQIEIPAGAPSLHRMGSEQGAAGKIVLSTNHPEVPKLEISVLFVIQD